MTSIEELLAACPPYTKTCFILPLRNGPEDIFACAAPGDALQLDECPGGIPTGRRVIAIVLAQQPALRIVPTPK